MSWKTALTMLLLFQAPLLLTIWMNNDEHNGVFVASYDLLVEVQVFNNGSRTWDLSSTNVIKEVVSQWAFINTSYQKGYVLSVKVNESECKYLLSMDEHGNVVVTPDLSSICELRPGDCFVVTYLFHIDVLHPKQVIDLDLVKMGALHGELSEKLMQYVKPVGLWNWSSWSNFLEFKQLALKFSNKSSNPLDVVFAIVNWFDQNIKYSSQSIDPIAPSEVLKKRRGDCDDQANLFVAFCRFNGIPAYTEIGAIYLPGFKDSGKDDVVKYEFINVGYHAWARVYIPLESGGVWLPVDLTFYEGKGVYGHIEGAAILKSNCMLNVKIVDFDYISLIKKVKEQMRELGGFWHEKHVMRLGNIRSRSVVLSPHLALTFSMVLSLFLILGFLLAVRRIKLRYRQ